MRYADALKMADDCMTYRITVKEYAMKYGLHATFMPKPLFGKNGSGMHTHQSLFKGERNAFFDADDQYFLSDVGKAFIAGQLRHAREICSIFAQWVNSYKRLVPGYEAPVYVAWSRRNRSALVRVPLYHPGKEQATRMELRCPDPACNPYLTFAALLQAGLEGIEKGYELPEPMEKNLYHLSPDERRRLGIEQLPETLGEAIELTAESELVLRTLGEHMFNRYIEIKRQEWDDYRVQVTHVGARPLPAGAVGSRSRRAALVTAARRERVRLGDRRLAGEPLAHVGGGPAFHRLPARAAAARRRRRRRPASTTCGAVRLAHDRAERLAPRSRSPTIATSRTRREVEVERLQQVPEAERVARRDRRRQAQHAERLALVARLAGEPRQAQQAERRRRVARRDRGVLEILAPRDKPLGGRRRS